MAYSNNPNRKTSHSGKRQIPGVLPTTLALAKDTSKMEGLYTANGKPVGQLEYLKWVIGAGPKPLTKREVAKLNGLL